MKIAIKENEIFTDFANRFGEKEIQMPPYNYILTEVDDDIDIGLLEFTDFAVDEGEYCFDRAAYDQRLEQMRNDNYERRYKANIESDIRRKYSVNDEIALLRQRECKPDEYVEYYNYVESVKAKYRRA